MGRCERNSYWLGGVKVRSGEATALVGGGPLRVVCRTARAGEINVRDLVTGTAVEIPGVGVLSFDAQHCRGRRGSSVDCEAIAAQLPRGVKDRYLKRMMQTRSDTRSVMFAVSSGAAGSREVFQMVQRSPGSWMALAQAEAGNDTLGWGLETVVDAITDPAVLAVLMQSRRGMLQVGAMSSLAKAGHAQLLCEGITAQLALIDTFAQPWRHRGTAIVLLRYDGMLGEKHNLLHTLLNETNDPHGVLHDLLKPPSWPGHTLHEGPTGEAIARTLLMQPLESWHETVKAQASKIAVRMKLNGVPSAGELMTRLGTNRVEFSEIDELGLGVTGGHTSRLTPTFVRSTSEAARHAAAREAWQASVTSIIEARGESDDGGAAKAWMQMGYDKGLEVNAWSSAAFDPRMRGRIVGMLDESELRTMLPYADSKTLPLMLRRLADDEAWLSAARGAHRRTCLQTMPEALLQRALHEQGEIRTVREVAAARGVLSPAVAITDTEWQVRAAGAAKTRDAGLIGQALQDQHENVVRIAMRRCVDTAALEAVAGKVVGGRLSVQIETRILEVRWYDVAMEALRKGEIAVARAAIREITHEDLLRSLARAGTLSEWCGEQLMKSQKAPRIKHSKR